MPDPTSYDISIVIALYNEASVLPALFERVNGAVSSVTAKVEVVLVDDGSDDETLAIMTAKAMEDGKYQVVGLSRNYGHQVAVTAGLRHARGTRAVMIIDGDLQDPPEMLPELLNKLDEGYDVVYGIRKARKEGLAKRISYWAYYRILRRISNYNVPIDTGDFCIMSRRVVDAINRMPEESRYLRGMRSWVGFKQIGVEYERSARESGSPKYTFRKLLSLASDGIFNFSNLPIRVVLFIGLVVVVLSFAYAVFLIIRRLFFGGIPEGYAAVMTAVILFGGVQLVSLGVLGEYVLRIFRQVKNRPLFLVATNIRDRKDTANNRLSRES